MQHHPGLSPTASKLNLDSIPGDKTARTGRHRAFVPRVKGALTLSFILLLLFSSKNLISQNAYPTWTEVAPSHVVRVEAQTIQYGGELYFFNGFHTDLDIENTVEKFNPVTNTWTYLAPMPLQPDGKPYAVTHNGIALVDDQVWIIGGRVGDHPGPVTNKVWIYDISQNSWNPGPALPNPAAAGGVGRLGRKLHYVGGLDAQAFCDINSHFVYDLDNPEAGWQDLTSFSPLPDARNHFATTVLNGKLYVIGGQHGHDGCEMGVDVDLVDVYDPTTNLWTRAANLPAVQSHIEPSTFVLDGLIYVVGGQINGNEVLSYDPLADEWTVQSDYQLPSNLLAPGARVIGNYFVVANGGTQGATAPSNKTYLRDFERSPKNVIGFVPEDVALSLEAGQTQVVSSILYNEAGEDNITYSLSTSGIPNWLSVTPVSGIARESFAEISITINSTGVSPGTYRYDLAVSAEGYTGDILPIIFTVNDDTGEPPPSGPQDISFKHSLLGGNTVAKPTSLQFGPDGRLYVAQQNGTILAYTIVRNASSEYVVTATETILLVKNIPNRNDDGTSNTVEKNRQVTGILVTGTAQAPVLYVGSSDPRIGGGGTGGDKNLDTNSGIISRLKKENGVWTKVDLVRGLPRSEENHANNGMQLDEENNILLVAVGGSTNAGAPSNNFAFLTEYALSAAILAIDLDVIDAMPVKGSGANQYIYDLPTLDDPARSNVANPDYDPLVPGSPQTMDVNDPFGGNDGLNQAKLIPGGPVTVYSSGYRNVYDLVMMKSPGREGRIYTIDNGPNGGWGGHPANEGAFGNPLTSNVTNNYIVGEPGSSTPGPNDAKVNNLDNLHLVSAPGLSPIYGGHPNPIRANPGGAGLYWFNNLTGTATFSLNPTADWPPVPLSMANPVEGDYRNPGVNDGALLTFSSSTNGIAEYTATTFFGGALTGELVTALYDGSINRIRLNGDGTQALSNEVLASGFGGNPLDVICQGDNSIFPGTIWVAAYGSSTIHIFEPDEPLSWRNLVSIDGSVPQARHENAYAEAGGKFYLIGGRGSRDLDIYDPATNKWSKGAKPPVQFHHFQAVTLNGLIYVLGAFVGNFPAETPVPNVYVYNPSTNAWAIGAAIPENRRRGGAGAVVYNNKIYLVCGIQNGHQSGWVPWLDVFDPATNTWTQLPDAPRARDHFHAALVDKQIFNIAGRRTGEDGFTYARTVAEIDVFDLTTNTWKTLPASANIPTPRAGTAVAVMDKEVIVVGGESSQALAHNETEAFDITLNTWRTLPNLNTGRHGTQIVTHGGRLYIAAGSGSRGGSPELNTQEVFTFSQFCSGQTTSFDLDDDNDGYSNGDETENGTNPCSALNTPPDFNRNFLSDLNDPDDDGDGVLDANDAFARDASNGITTKIPIDYPFLADNPGTGLFGLGFTGLMTNGVTDYLSQYDANHPDLIMGGAVGLASFPASKGDALSNDQLYAFQFGVGVNSNSNTFIVESQMLGNFFNGISVNQLQNQTQGIYIGKGNQDDYLKIVLAANNGNPGIQVLCENEGVVVHNEITAISNILAAEEIHLLLKVDARLGTVQPQYFTSSSPVITNLGTPITLTGPLKLVVQGSQAMAVGLMASAGNANPFLVSYNFIKITSPSPFVANAIPDVSKTVNSGNHQIDLSSVFGDDGGVGSLTYSVQNNSNTNLVTQASISGNILTLAFKPSTTGTAQITVRATDAQGLFVDDEFNVTIANNPVALIRLNSGGPQINFNQEVWQVDQYATGGTTFTSNLPIEGTDNDAIYQSERYGIYNYEIPVSTGTYDVRLHFAEIFYGVSSGGAGSRVFNVNVENGQAQLLNYDIFKKAGGAGKPIVEYMNAIYVNDGFLTIALTKIANNPKLSAIEIFSTAIQENLPPVVIDPGDQSYNEGSSVTLQIQGSDPNPSDVVTFSATGLPASLVIDSNTGLITGSIEADAGQYPVTVKVMDQQGLFDEETFLITITEAAGATQLLLAMNTGGPSLIFDGIAWQADQYASGGSTYSKVLAIAGTENDKIYQSERYGTFSYSIPLQAGTYTVKLHIAEIFYTAPAKRIFHVTAENAPWLTNYDIFADVGYATAAIKTKEITVTDGTLNLQFTPKVNNAKVSGIEIYTAATGNRAPTVALSIPDQSAAEGIQFAFTFHSNTFADPDGDVLTYTARLSNDSALPAWLSFNSSTRTFTGTPLTAHVGTLDIKVTASDGQASVSDNFLLSVQSAPTNTPPVLSNAIPDQVATEGIAYNFTFPENTFTDADSDVLSYTASLSSGAALPSWLTFNSTTRTFAGTPLTANVGVLEIRVTASDGQASVNDNFLLTTESAQTNTPPVVANPIPDQEATEGVVFSFTFQLATFTDANNDPLTYIASLSNDTPLPGWLSFNGATRTFSGTPLTANVGNIDIKVTASDGQASVSDNFVLVVLSAQTNSPPVVSNVIPDQEATEGALYSFTFALNTFTDADNDPLSYSASLSNDAVLPNWLVFNSSTRTFSGTPTSADEGIIMIKVMASDGEATVNDVFSLTIEGINDAPVVANVIPDQTAPAGSAFNFIVAANTFSDADGDLLSYAASLSNDLPLPGWLDFNTSTRTFSGMPSSANIGSIEIKVTASDGDAIASDIFILTVEAAGPVTLRINVGGNNYTSTTGILFEQDKNFSSIQSTVGFSAKVVANTTESILYQSYRAGNFSYNFSVVNGSYQVVLHFNEVWDGKIPGKKGVGTRTFNVKAEGIAKLTNYDVFARAGAASRAVRETILADVTDQMLNLEFIPVNNAAIVSAIEVIPVNAFNASLSNRDIIIIDSKGSGLKLYPNPVDDVIYVEFEGEIPENMTVSIVDQLGRSYLDTNPTLDGKGFWIELTDYKLSRGMYYLRINSQEYNEIIKFVKN